MVFQNTIIVGANLVLSLTSAGVNFYAANKGLPKQRPVYMAIGVVSVIYAIAWGWLLVLGANDETWTSIMRGFTLLAWVVTWIAPAFVSIHIWKEMRRALQARLESEE